MWSQHTKLPPLIPVEHTGSSGMRGTDYSEAASKRLSQGLFYFIDTKSMTGQELLQVEK